MPPRRSAGVVIVRPADDGWRYLLLRSFKNWDFPKGIVEPGETPIAAAVREVREETSLDDLELRWGESFCETAPYAGGKVACYYVAVSPGAEVDLPVSAELGRPEHHEYRWVTAEEARGLLPPRLQPILDFAVQTIRG